MSLVGTPFGHFLITHIDIFTDKLFQYLDLGEWWAVDKALDGALIEACEDAYAYEDRATDDDVLFLFLFLVRL